MISDGSPIGYSLTSDPPSDVGVVTEAGRQASPSQTMSQTTSGSSEPVPTEYGVADTRSGGQYSMLEACIDSCATVNCLLGLDWLHSVGAIVDFAPMTAESGPTEKVQLIIFCNMKIGQTLMPCIHTRVRCRVVGCHSSI